MDYNHIFELSSNFNYIYYETDSLSYHYTYVNHFIDDNPMIFVIIYGLEDYSHIMSLFTFSIIWPCVLDLFEYQILSTTFHYVFNESCRDSLFIVIVNWIHVSDLAYEMMLYKKEQYTKSLYFV